MNVELNGARLSTRHHNRKWCDWISILFRPWILIFYQFRHRQEIKEVKQFLKKKYISVRHRSSTEQLEFQLQHQHCQRCWLRGSECFYFEKHSDAFTKWSSLSRCWRLQFCSYLWEILDNLRNGFRNVLRAMSHPSIVPASYTEDNSTFLHFPQLLNAASQQFTPCVSLSCSTAPPALVGFGESVDTCWDHQLMFPDLPLQEGLQFVDVHLRDHGPRGDEHAEHRVDAVQRHAVQVCEHGLDVGPEQLQRWRFGLITGLHAVTALCVCVYLQLLLPLLWLGGGVGVSLLVTVDQHHASVHLLFRRARLHHAVAAPGLLPQHAVLLPQSQLPVHQLLRGAQLRTQLLQIPGAWPMTNREPVRSQLCWSDVETLKNFASSYIF